jgi:hypothetical protein
VEPLKRPGYVWLAVAGGAVALGWAGSLLGPAWAFAGAVAGPLVALTAVTFVQVLA